jgi:hypothetical protein
MVEDRHASTVAPEAVDSLCGTSGFGADRGTRDRRQAGRGCRAHLNPLTSGTEQDPAAREVVRADLHEHPVEQDDLDVVLLIFPLMWASTVCPFSSSTWKVALGRDSTTVPSTSIPPDARLIG